MYAKNIFKTFLNLKFRYGVKSKIANTERNYYKHFVIKDFAAAAIHIITVNINGI